MNERELVIAIIRVGQNLHLSPDQTAELLKALAGGPEAKKTFDAAPAYNCEAARRDVIEAGW